MSNWRLCRKVRTADRPFSSIRRRRKTRSTVLTERDGRGGYFLGLTGLPDFTCRLQFVFKALQEEDEFKKVGEQGRGRPMGGLSPLGMLF